jgi:hypothetical protein
MREQSHSQLQLGASIDTANATALHSISARWVSSVMRKMIAHQDVLMLRESCRKERIYA